MYDRHSCNVYYLAGHVLEGARKTAIEYNGNSKITYLVMNDIGLKYEQLCGLTTDGASSVVGQINDVIALM